MSEIQRDVLKLPAEVKAELIDAPRTENLSAAMGTLEIEHRRRRNLLEAADKAEHEGLPDVVKDIYAAMSSESSAKRELAAWNDFISLNPTIMQAAKVLQHVSHFDTKPTMLDTAFSFFFGRIQQEEDRGRIQSAMELAMNAIRSRHIGDADKQLYLQNLQSLKLGA